MTKRLKPNRGEVGRAAEWRAGLLNLTCPVRTHHVSRFLNNLATRHLSCVEPHAHRISSSLHLARRKPLCIASGWAPSRLRPALEERARASRSLSAQRLRASQSGVTVTTYMSGCIDWYDAGLLQLLSRTKPARAWPTLAAETSRGGSWRHHIKVAAHCGAFEYSARVQIPPTTVSESRRSSIT